MDSGKNYKVLSKPLMPADLPKRLIDLSECVKFLEENNNLLRVKSEVEAVHELAGIAKKLEGRKPVLFENVKGSAFPVLIGLLWNREIVGSIFNTRKEEVSFLIAEAIGA